MPIVMVPQLGVTQTVLNTYNEAAAKMRLEKEKLEEQERMKKAVEEMKKVP